MLYLVVFFPWQLFRLLKNSCHYSRNLLHSVLWYLSSKSKCIYFIVSGIITSAAQSLLSCLTLCDHMGHSPWNSLGKNIGVGCHPLLQGSSLPMIKPTSVSPAFQANSFTAEIPGKPSGITTSKYKKWRFYFSNWF